MKPLIFARNSKKLYYEEERLRKTIKGSLEANNISYATNVFENYDLVHFINYCDLKKINDAKRAGLNVVMSALYCENIHAVSMLNFKEESIKLKGKCLKCLNACDLILVPGELSKKILLDKKITSPIVVFPNPINFKRFDFKKNVEKDLFYRYFGERPENKIVLSIGDYSNKIELQNLIDVASLCSSYKFYFIGANYNLFRNSKYKKIAPKNVIFSKLIDDDIYRSTIYNADVLLVLDPRRAETLSVFEAMACKTQIIGFCDGKNSVLKNNLNSYFSMGAFDIASLIDKYFKNKIKSTVEGAFIYIKENDLKKCGQKLNKIYNSFEVNKGGKRIYD